MTSVLRNPETVLRFAERNARIVCRSAPKLSGRKLGGYAAVFGPVADLGMAGRESLDPGSLDEAMASDPDVRALINHDPQRVLGRTRAGTLRLSLDSTGLEYEVDLPDTTYARDLRELVERGDIDGASFGFVPGLVERRSGVLVHTMIAEVVDVSPVTFPAYGGATAELRSRRPPVSRRSSQIIRARAIIQLGR